MNEKLTRLSERLAAACLPEDVFGALDGPPGEQAAGLKKRYREMARLTHPDAYFTPLERTFAEQTFIQLAGWLEQAEKRVKAGQYGRAPGSSAGLTLCSRKREYTIQPGYTEAGLYNCYPCQFELDGQVQQAVLKVVRQPENNDLAQNEAQVLQCLQAGPGAARFSPYFPALYDAFAYRQAGADHQALVVDRPDGWVTLEAVHHAYPRGIDPKDMAWIWRRLLTALGHAHRCGVIHAAVLPGSISIHPALHGLRLENWLAARTNPQESGEWVTLLDLRYQDWYPVEITRRQAPLPGTDIGMSARCMVYLLSGEAHSTRLPTRVPRPLRQFLAGCLLPGRLARPQDAWALKQEFDELLTRLWGKRTFHPFSMTGELNH